MDKLYVLVKEQFPEFVQADYPKFVEFVQAYYKWLEQELPEDLKTIVDIDQTPDQYLEYFIKQLDVYGILTDTTPYVKKYIRNIKEIYTAKGTEQGLLFLLKAVYNADVTVDQPIKYVLKASDGRWIKESFITLRTFFGSFESIADWDFSYDCRCAGRDQRIPVTRTEIVDGETIRLYYQQVNSITTFIGQRINIFNSFGALTYTGIIIPSPSKIDVIAPGKGWRVGQVIVWPGSEINTVVRVADITEEGGIKRIEIVNIGYEHTDGETYIASPFPVRPIGANFQLNQVQISTDDPPAFEYTLDIDDQMQDVTDNAAGYAGGLKFNPYFLENYQEDLYVGTLVFARNTFSTPPTLGQSTVTLEEWIESRAILRYTFATTGTLRGFWADESGHISTDSIRIQDSFYYQQFSYVIESDINPFVYRNLAAAVHLAGAKLFTKFNATSIFKLDTGLIVTFPFIVLNVLDVAQPFDTHFAEVTKLSADQVATPDNDAKTFEKLSLPVDVTLAQDAVAKDITKPRSNTIDALDGITLKDVIKNTQSVIEGIDVVSKTINITKSPDTVTAQDLISKRPQIPLVDVVETAESSSRTPAKGVDDNVTSSDKIDSKSSTKYREDGVLSIDTTVKRPTRVLSSSVEALSPDTSSLGVNEYFLGSEEYVIPSERYAQVSAVVTIPE